ncbi:DMT family transporter [Planococcus lenghuensis]|uniref:QacE family quaternary ammonium compound efflux SMR transporter n=1 Tax=Planococcus lenghuensis TaxID=2213202 RepID=A0A1Q2L3J0_9BACL|nr:multidrug efflux SMR transporter [Planococcus lenghuensis]AQQ54991.1 QacE family quaternary ammonium compound efflux SMR transporter [Planococcus lenghuensis]
MAYLYLALSIAGELLGTSMIKASDGFTKPLPTTGVIISFVFSFFFLSLSLKVIPLNMAYAIWSGVGTAATVVISVLIWKEKITAGSIVGILLIIFGVAVLNLYGPGHSASAEQTTAANEQSL